MLKTVVTDYTMDNLDIERSILEPLGCTVVSNKAFVDIQSLKTLLTDADYVITQFAPVNAEVIGAMQKCRVIVRYGIGVDNIDLIAANEKGIPVCNVPDYCIDEVADHTLSMILNLTRRLHENTTKVRSGIWGMGVPVDSMKTLKDMTVGIVAYGRIGKEVAHRLKPFKCRIIVSDPHINEAEIKAAGYSPASLDELYGQSDLITLHCPSTEQNRQMINATSIRKMKQEVIIVNISRGTLVKTEDLTDALQNQWVSAAGLDVIDPEPIAPDHPLLSMNNVLLTSHIASVSPRAIAKLRSDAASLVAMVIRGENPQNIVNAPN